MTAAEILHELERLIRETAADELPALVGELEAAKVRAWSRLILPEPSSGRQPHVDQNICVKDAARRLGVSKEWLYRNARSLPFAVRIGRRVLFSERGLDRWNRQHKGLTP